ncbi:hypothetical protein [Acetobacter sp. DsW_063]|uniref:hypothetical protein n=1 Tax=Acetobacter sp. DsW_063 TaxID=1514894 RepID=UPI000B6A018B|nr:hypothetical protein [Acetobacter sp. DsW_063]OUJ14867.1 hypothetical protein HK28_10930 [Acetobacter sp. DsW_063]
MALISGSFSGGKGGNVPHSETASDAVAVVSPITDDFFCLVGEICQQRVCASEVTALLSDEGGQVGPDHRTWREALSSDQLWFARYAGEKPLSEQGRRCPVCLKVCCIDSGADMTLNPPRFANDTHGVIKHANRNTSAFPASGSNLSDPEYTVRRSAVSV